MTPTYDRSPSEQLHKLLSQGEFLASLLGLSCRRVADCELDVHFRPDDEVHVPPTPPLRPHETHNRPFGEQRDRPSQHA